MTLVLVVLVVLVYVSAGVCVGSAAAAILDDRAIGFFCGVLWPIAVVVGFYVLIGRRCYKATKNRMGKS